jgi:hypothetical protein
LKIRMRSAVSSLTIRIRAPWISDLLLFKRFNSARQGPHQEAAKSTSEGIAGKEPSLICVPEESINRSERKSMSGAPHLLNRKITRSRDTIRIKNKAGLRLSKSKKRKFKFTKLKCGNFCTPEGENVKNSWGGLRYLPLSYFQPLKSKL